MEAGIWRRGGMDDASHPKFAQTDHEILDVIRQRWSPRAFDPDRIVTPSEARRLFEAARWAPSSLNEQPWRFVVADRERSSSAFAAFLACLRSRNQLWAASAPMLVLVAVRRTLERNDAVNDHAWYDAGQAVAFLTLQATAMGLSVRQMEGFDHAAARIAADVPAPFEPAVMMSIGYAGDPETLTLDAHRLAERQPRARRALSDIVF